MAKVLELALFCAILCLSQSPSSLAQNSPQDFLNLHNAVRQQIGHGLRPLTWNSTLEAYARKYAQVRSKDCELIHSGGPYGENIYWGMGEGWTDAAAAMRSWVDEEKDYYDYASNTCIMEKDCLHYTQVASKTSKRLGCARSECSNERVFITCNYDPPGNVIGERPY